MNAPSANRIKCLPIVTTKQSFDSSQYIDQPILTDYHLRAVVHPHITDLNQERSYVISLDGRQRIRSVVPIDPLNGSNTQDVICQTIKAALCCNAEVFAIVHYRTPEQSLKPTKHDVDMVQRIVDSVMHLELIFYDMVILQKSKSTERFAPYSMACERKFGKKFPRTAKEVQELMKESDKLKDVPWKPLPQHVEEMRMTHKTKAERMDNQIDYPSR